MKIARAVALVAWFVACFASAGGPPPEVLAKVNGALGVLDGQGFVGTYLLTTRVEVDAPGRKSDTDTEEVRRVTLTGDGAKVTTLVRATADGRDVTQEKQAEESREKESHEEEERGEIDEGMLPLGKRADDYVFSAPRLHDGLMVARFRPVAGARPDDEDDFLSEGELAWDPATGDPVRIDLEPTENPPHVSKLHIRFDFARSEGTLYLSRVDTVTRGGIPIVFRVKAHVVVEITDVHPASAVGPTGVPGASTR